MTLEAIDRELATIADARRGYGGPVFFICLGGTLTLVGLPVAFLGLFTSLALFVGGLAGFAVGLAMLIGGNAGAVAVGNDNRVYDARVRELESMRKRTSEPPAAAPPSVMRPVGGMTLALF